MSAVQMDLFAQTWICAPNQGSQQQNISKSMNKG